MHKTSPLLSSPLLSTPYSLTGITSCPMRVSVKNVDLYLEAKHVDSLFPLSSVYLLHHLVVYR